MEIVNRTIAALRQITVPRYFRTERGFVTEFYCQLTRQLEQVDLFPAHTILETEVQKNRIAHYGLTQRPDLLIHIPIETGLTQNANENNFVVFAFKLGGNPARVQSDYDKLEEMFHHLNYATGIFINIGAYPTTYLDTYNGNFRDRIHELSIATENGETRVRHTFFVEGVINSVER
jgi:hypothetical protein